MAGQGFASRVAASLLSDNKKTEFVGKSLEAYAAAAKALAGTVKYVEPVAQWSIDESVQSAAFIETLCSV
jgi:predicted O-linked N-acetylglucosamine transferase (SPINDLY family)